MAFNSMSSSSAMPTTSAPVVSTHSGDQIFEGVQQSWCPEPDSNRHGPVRVLGILSPESNLSSEHQRAVRRSINEELPHWYRVFLSLTSWLATQATVPALNGHRGKGHRTRRITRLAAPESTFLPTADEICLNNVPHRLDNSGGNESLRAAAMRPGTEVSDRLQRDHGGRKG